MPDGGLRAAVAAVAVAAAATAAVPLWHGAGDHADGGPLQSAPRHGYALTVREGASFTDGMESLVVEGDQPAVLESVELVGAPGLKVLGFQLVKPEREVTLQWMPNLPPADRGGALDRSLIIDGPGATIRPHVTAGWELLLGLRVTKAGPLWREGIRVNYQVDGKRYSRFLPAELAVCTSPEQEVDHHCMPPDRT